MRKIINIVGGGPCALMLALELDPKKFEVRLFEKNKQVARKFLVAGEGGLNLTHSEAAVNFLSRYTPYHFLEESFLHFSNADLINWLSEQGIKTFVGSSGRVFPIKGTKPIDVLNILLTRISQRGAKIYYSFEWKGFANDTALVFQNKDKVVQVKGDFTIFCLGGASWPVTGSAGDWLNIFRDKHILVNNFEASNCAFRVNWPDKLKDKIEGKVLKNCRFSCDKKSQIGEVVLTQFGIEGSGIYPLSPQIRKEFKEKGKAVVGIDFKPDVSFEKLLERLSVSKTKPTYTGHVQSALNLNDPMMRLLKHYINQEGFLRPHVLAGRIKHFELPISGTGPVEDAISTVGGIDLTEVDRYFELKKLKRHFVIGEMLDFDAPTGGYLLQSCFSMANFLAHHLNSLTTKP